MAERKRKHSTSQPTSSFPPPPSDEQELKIYNKIKDFVVNESMQELKLPGLTSKERYITHSVADKFHLAHRSEGEGDERTIILRKLNLMPITDNMTIDRASFRVAALIWNQMVQQEMIYKLAAKTNTDLHANAKEPSSNVQAIDPKLAALLAAGTVTKDEVTTQDIGKIATEYKSARVQEAKPHPTGSPPKNCFRFVGWNIEWMDHFFEGSGNDVKIATKSHDGSVNDVPALARSIAGLIKRIDPDVLTIEEGPASIERMNLFCNELLDGKYEAFGGIDGGQQRVYILVKKGGKVKNPRIHQKSMEFLSREWHFDVSGDFNLVPYNFTRTPVVIEAEVEDGGNTRSLFIIGVHTKSKFIARGQRLWNSNNPAFQIEFIRKAVKNRRRIAGECTRLRKCIDEVIFGEQPDAWVIVSGDFNDGPGTDFFEEYYLLSDCISNLLGSPFYFRRLLHATLLEHTTLEQDNLLYTVVFNDFVDKIKDKRVLLDHILVSASLNQRVQCVGIAHDLFREFSKDYTSMKREDRVSDHIPVYSDFYLTQKPAPNSS